MRRIFLGTMVWVFLTMAPLASAATGFVDDPIWLYPENPKEGEMVTLTALFRNAETKSLSGVVSFYDEDVLLGKKTITIPAGGFVPVALTFRVGAGAHAFSASVTSLAEVLSTGESVPFAIPLETAELSKFTIGRSIADQLTAKVTSAAPTEKTADGKTTDTKNPKLDAQSASILEQVEKIEDTVLDAIPDSVEKDIAETFSGVDAWRDEKAQTITTARDAAKRAVDAQSKDSAADTKKLGAPSASNKYIDSPIAYVKYFFLALFSFIFMTKAVFYLVGTILAYIVLRFLYRKIRNGIRKGRESHRRASMPHAPDI